ncbi:MAG: CrcB family protein [Acidimicrobiia bacterium]|nr:CrcB family protein [Acidimicrobiia bacterium]
MLRPADLPWVFVAGAAGAWSRYGVAAAVREFSEADPLWATLIVNVVGTFALAMFLVRKPGRRARLAAGTGFLGSFTTFSAFAVDTLEAGFVRGVLYVVLSLGLGWAAVQLGSRERA